MRTTNDSPHISDFIVSKGKKHRTISNSRISGRRRRHCQKQRAHLCSHETIKSTTTTITNDLLQLKIGI